MINDNAISSPESPQVIKIYCCCDDRDKKFLSELDSHCAGLKRSGEICISYNQEILPGTPKEDLINSYLNVADIILLLISKHFYSSDLCIGVMERALEQYKMGKVQIIPVLLSPYFYQGTPIEKLQWLPNGKSEIKAITQWKDRQEAYVNIISGIWSVILALREREINGEERSYHENVDIAKEKIATPVFSECKQAIYLCEQAIRLNHHHAYLYQEKEAIIFQLKRYGELKGKIDLKHNSMRIYEEMILVLEDLAERVPKLLNYLATYTDEIARQSQDGTQ
jgi:hypothetical protein